MKKVMFSLAMVAACAWAQEAPKKDAENSASAPVAQPQAREVKMEKASWPVWVAFNSTKNIDVVGMRITLPYGACEGLTGFDLGLFGRCRYMEGFQLNILRNEAEDVMTGFQIGFYNTAGRSDLLGVQIGLWNEAQSISGIQAGIINVANTVSGFQIGLINRSESLYGVQIGAVNVIRSAEPSFLPLVNVGFESFGTPAF
ncbi:MAG: hypothetical protein J6R18_06735 [Kiritimatiellae bacterium]|nr:hypothetical protein [Kiritimatiellia bacterium]